MTGPEVKVDVITDWSEPALPDLVRNPAWVGVITKHADTNDVDEAAGDSWDCVINMETKVGEKYDGQTASHHNMV